jgi:choline dehydrogenase-like flavoprotein
MLKQAADWMGERAVRDADYCIVGAGPVGITLARAFATPGRHVLLLESGGESPGGVAQQLNAAETLGARYPNPVTSRLRGLGGTSALWAGWCRWPTEDDFAGYSWSEARAWPMTAAELAPYQGEAERLVELDAGGWNPAEEAARRDARAVPLPAGLVYRLTRFSPPVRFYSRYGDELRRSQDIEVVLGATVTKLEVAAGAVRSVLVVASDGTSRTVRARRYVLACGGLENARLLLLSADEGGRIPGNGGGWVGRGFMDHVKLPAGWFMARDPSWQHRIYTVPGGSDLHCKLHLAVVRDVLARNGWLPCHFELTSSGAGMPSPQPDAVQAGVRWLAGRPESPPQLVHLRVDPEPDREARVELGAGRDVLGVPQARLTWSPTARERRTFFEAREYFARAVGAAGLGRFWLVPYAGDAPFPPDEGRVTYGNHHLGATRMARDEESGVVDVDGRVFGVANLWMAGASVLPSSSGYPTIIALALALRLVRHLEEAAKS